MAVMIRSYTCIRIPGQRERGQERDSVRERGGDERGRGTTIKTVHEKQEEREVERASDRQRQTYRERGR